MSDNEHNESLDDNNDSLTQADSSRIRGSGTVPSSPLFVAPSSNGIDEEEEQQQHGSQRLREQAVDIRSDASSPMVFSSSQPASDGARSGNATPAHISSQGNMSSPLHYTSSSQNHSDLNSDARRSRQALGSGRTGRFSDMGSELRSDLEARRRAGTDRLRRGDIHSSDLSSPRRERRIFQDVGPSHTGSGAGDEGINSDDLHISSALASNGNEEEDPEPFRVIWGTNVNINDCTKNFRNFLMSFKMKYRKLEDNEDIEEGDDDFYYLNELNQMRESGLTNLNLDTRNLLAFAQTKKLYYQLLNYPQEVIPIMDQALKDSMVSLVLENNLDFDITAIESQTYKIRPFNVDTEKGMRELNPNDIDKLVCIKGLVLRSTPIIPDMKLAFFKCSVCDHTVSVEIDRGVIQEPTVCPRPVCGQRNSMVLIHNRSIFADKQVVRIQETPDIVPDGQTPHSVSLCVYDELVDSTRAGDRVEVTGIFRSVPVRVNTRQRALKRLFKTYIDVVHIKKIDKKRLEVDATINKNAPLPVNSDVEEVRKITDEEISQIHKVAAKDDIYEVLARSLAPSIFELDDVKKGILLQLFGGTNKQFKKGGKYRGDINILLCGDPSTSKSQLLQYVHKIAPRGIYTSGKGSSAVGLTAYVTRDVDSRQLVLESGALVLSDGGVCCIDEFDKMSDITRSVLHEAMEQQTISIAKAGIITTLNARTSILASANPIESRYNPDLPVTQNIDLPPPLLSRFDLVYLILDKVDKRIDKELAKHITNMYLEDTPENVSSTEILPVEFLTLYISYAKKNYHPKITPEAKDELVKNYVDMRKMGDDARNSERRITATTRQLESMIRLSEAHAKMRLSHYVELQDVYEAVRLIKSAIKDYATDPITGKIDMDLVQTGQSSAQRRLAEDLVKTVDAFLQQLPTTSINFIDLLKRLNETSQEPIENAELGEVIRRLEQQQKLVVKMEGARRMIIPEKSPF